MSMPAISILQPYAWLIVRPDITDPADRARAYLDGRIKDIENRGWHTRFRGRILVHAGKKLGKRAYEDDREFYAEGEPAIILPKFDDMPRGGIVGAVDIIDCVKDHPSQWKAEDSWGFVLANATPCEFKPYRGQLGIFPVEKEVFA